ncbi:MAG: hypothetical protein R3E12_15910 [Candidatus Eisenbacteria bacterium]
MGRTTISGLTAVLLARSVTLSWDSVAQAGNEPQKKAEATSDATDGAHAAQAQPAAAKAVTVEDLPEHPVTIGTGTKDFVIDPIPRAEMGRVLPPSELEKMEGFEYPYDPERDAVTRGRRVAPEVDFPLQNGFTSLQSLVNEIMIGLKSGDPKHLDRLCINSDEFKKICWPEFPQSRPAPQIPVDEAYFFLDRNQVGGIAKGMGLYKGMDLHAVRVHFDPGVKRYRNFNLYDGMTIFAKTQDEKAPPVEIKFVNTIIERNGLFKVYTYKD